MLFEALLYYPSKEAGLCRYPGQVFLRNGAPHCVGAGATLCACAEGKTEAQRREVTWPRSDCTAGCSHLPLTHKAVKGPTCTGQRNQAGGSKAHWLSRQIQQPVPCSLSRCLQARSSPAPFIKWDMAEMTPAWVATAEGSQSAGH